MTTATVAALDTPLTRIVDATAEALTAEPARAVVVFDAAATGHDAVASTIALGEYRVEVDEPPSLGGADTAPNPVQYYLASLLSCQIVTYRFWADRLGLRIDRITATAEGDLDVRGFFGLDDAVRAGFTEVRVNVDIAGPDDAERYRELHRAVDEHCPVLDLTANPTPVVTTLSVVE
ncbi:MAG TPA: OsmC family protein [Nakamurella sp.]|nr:OsmC family protein [Nakamurella sp.]